MDRDELIYECYILREYDCDDFPEKEYLNYLTELTTDELLALSTRLTRLSLDTYTLA